MSTPAATPAHAAAVDPCEVAHRATSEALASLRATIDARADAQTARAALDDVARPLDDCRRTGGGAWALVAEDASLVSDDSGAQVGMSARPVFIDDAGTVHRASAVLPVGVDLGDEPGTVTTATLMSDFDYDGDGTSEVFVLDDENYVGNHRSAIRLLTFHGAVEAYGPADEIDVDDVADSDGDGRPDIVSNTSFWSASECGQDSDAEGAPPVLFHSRADGTFSATDDAAASWLRERCPAAPSVLLDPDWPCNAVTTIQNIACARLWGASAESVTRMLEGERASLSADERETLDPDWATVLAAAAVTPPLVLRAATP